MAKGEFSTELMHSSQGAFSESIYVYEPIIEWVFQHSLPPSFLTIGMGLGYLEIMITAYYLKYEKNKLTETDFLIQAFEAEAKLVLYFKNFFLNLPTPFLFVQVYNSILSKMAKYYQLSETELFNSVQQVLLDKKMVLQNSFTNSTVLAQPASGIFFDAFSPQSCPELWEEDLINNLLIKKNLVPNCCFATYASRGFLKRKLKEKSFQVKVKKGFMGKRESIFAIKIDH